MYISLLLENILVVTELIPRGSLERLLRSKHAPGKGRNYANLNCELNDRQLLKIALQIASGIQHLEESKVGAEFNVCIVVLLCDLS